MTRIAFLFLFVFGLTNISNSQSINRDDIYKYSAEYYESAFGNNCSKDVAVEDNSSKNSRVESKIVVEDKKERRRIGNASDPDKKWEKGGVFEGYTPEQEIVSRRTQGGKYFQNNDGTITAQIGGNYHYLDDDKAWQDIDYKIVKENCNGFAFQNKTNTFKTYYPATAGETGFKIKSDEVDINLWKSPELCITDESGNVLYKEFAQNSEPVLNDNILLYSSFNGVKDELKLIDFGVENNIYIDEFNAAWSFSNAKYISFKQTINFGTDVEVLNAKGERQNSDFEDEIIGFKFDSGQTIYLNKLIVFDSKANKEEAQLFYEIEKNKIPKNIKAKANSFYKGNYKIVFIDGGVEVHSVIEINWLNNANYPVWVDPTWTIGATSSGSYNGPLTHYYTFQRHANLYLQSEIGGYGNIYKIEYYKTNTASTRTKPTKVYMRNTTLTALTTANWNSSTYTGGLTALLNGYTIQDNTAGWKALDINSFNYNTGNLLIMVYDSYESGWSSQYFAQRSDATGLGSNKRQDSSDPGDASAMSVVNYRHTVRITYAPNNNPCASVTAMNCNTTYTATLTPNSGSWSNYTGVSHTYSGSEKVWSFTPLTSGQYVFNVNEGSNDADFFLMSACDPTSTNLSSGYWIGYGDETVNLTAGVTYYLIADLYSTNSTTVSVSVSETQMYGYENWNSYAYNGKDLNTYLGRIITGATSTSWGDLNYDWGDDGAIATCGTTSANNFSTAHYMYRDFTPGLYKITYSSDDGIRIGVKNELSGTTSYFVDKWTDNTHSGTEYMFLQGNRYFTVLHRENSGKAKVRVQIELVCEYPGWTYGIEEWRNYGWKDVLGLYYGEIYSGVNSNAWFNLDADWGSGHPTTACSAYPLPNDDFSTGHFMIKNFSAGTYTINYSSDDGIRISFDDGATWDVDKWNNSTHSGTFNKYLSGEHKVMVLHRERAGGARVNVKIQSPNPECDAIHISPSSIPIENQDVYCKDENLLNSTTVSSTCGGATNSYKSGKEALYKFTPSSTDNYEISYSGQTYSAIWVYQGCPTGNNCVASIGDSYTSKDLIVQLTAGVEYYIWFDTWAAPDSPCPGTFSLRIGPPPIPPMPTSNSPQCGNVTITLSGTRPSGVNWYLQTTADGTSTANSGASYTVSSSGTYYLRARRTSTQVWGDAVAINVIVKEIPTVSAGSNQTICIGESANLNGSVQTISPSINIGTTNTSYDYHGFANGLYNYSLSRNLYQASEIGTTGTITAFKIYVDNTPSNYTMNDQYIYLKNQGSKTEFSTTYNATTNGTISGTPTTDGFTLVYSGDLTFNGSGWYTITLATPFNYSGTGSLELIWENRDGSWESGYPNFRHHGSWGYNCHVRSYLDANFPENNNWSTNQNRYWIEFDITTTPSVTWSPATGLSSTIILNPVASPSTTTTYTITANADGCEASASVTVNVNKLNPGTITQYNQDVCMGATPAEFTGTAPSGSSNYTYQWEKQENCTGNWVAISGATSANYTPTGAASGDACYRRKVNSECGSAYSQTNTVASSNLKLHYSFNELIEPTINIITSIDPTFESKDVGTNPGLTNQLAAGSSIVQVSTTRAYQGAKSLHLNRLDGGNNGRVYFTHSILQGDVITYSAYCYSTVAGPRLRIEYNGGNYSWNSVQSSQHTGSGWERLTVTYPAATSATTGYFFMYSINNNSDTYWDNIQIEKKDHATPFVGGTRNPAYVIDHSGNNNHGTINYGTNPTWVENGYEAGAYTFNGTTDEIKIGNQSSLNINGNQTISMWIKPHVLNDGQRRNPYNKAYGGEGTITLEPNGTLNYYYGTHGGDGEPYQGFVMSNAIAVNQWVHLVIVRDFSSMKLRWYKNGELVNEANATYSTAASSSATAYLGKGYAGRFKGDMDDFRIYNKALTAEEVKELFNSNKAVIEIVKPSATTPTQLATNDYVWTGSISGNWETSPNNWCQYNGSDFVIPTSIPNSTSANVYVREFSSGTTTCASTNPSIANNVHINVNNLNIEADKVLNVTGNGSISLEGNLNNAGTLFVYSGSPTISLKGNWNNSGSFDAGTGIVIFNGGNQTLTGSSNFYNVKFHGTGTKTVGNGTWSSSGVAGVTFTTGTEIGSNAILKIPAETQWDFSYYGLWGESTGSPTLLINGGIVFFNSDTDIRPNTVIDIRDGYLYLKDDCQECGKLKQSGGLVDNTIYATSQCWFRISEGSELTGGMLRLRNGFLNHDRGFQVQGSITATANHTLELHSGNSTYELPIIDANANVQLGNVVVKENQGFNLGTGASLQILGNLTIESGKTLNAKNNTFSVAGNWNNSGSFVPGTGTVIFNPPSGTSTITTGGTGSGKQFYNVTIEANNSSGIVNLSGNIQINNNYTINSANQFNCNANTMTVGGNWTRNGGTFNRGTGTVNLTGTGKTIEGYQTIFRNLNISGTYTQNSTNITTMSTSNVGGDLTIASGASLNATSKEIEVGGNWTNNGTFTAGTGTVTFNGISNLQVIKAGGSPFNNVVFNNSSQGFNLPQATVINGQATFTDGVVKFTTSGSLSFGNNASSNIGNENSYVDGIITKTGSNAFNFATGDGENWGAVSIATPGTSSTISAKYFHEEPPYVNWNPGYMCAGSNMHHVSGIEYWMLESNAATPAVTLYWSDMSISEIVNPDSLTVAHWTGNCWENKGGNIVNYGNSGNVTSTIPFTSYSPITFGTTKPINPLPVELLRFDVSCQANNRVISWTTATETNNDYFNIERSFNGISYEIIGQEIGAGTTNIVSNYSFIDDSNHSGDIYYRITQVDFDGTAKTYDAQIVNCDGENQIIVVKPNPFQDLVEVLAHFDGQVRIDIYNSQAKLVYSELDNIEISKQLYLQDLKPGVYLLKITEQNGKTYNFKIVKR